MRRVCLSLRRSLAARSSVRGRLDALRERRVQALAAAAGLDRDALKPRAVASEGSGSEQRQSDQQERGQQAQSGTPFIATQRFADVSHRDTFLAR